MIAPIPMMPVWRLFLLRLTVALAIVLAASYVLWIVDRNSRRAEVQEEARQVDATLSCGLSATQAAEILRASGFLVAGPFGHEQLRNWVPPQRWSLPLQAPATGRLMGYGRKWYPEGLLMGRRFFEVHVDLDENGSVVRYAVKEVTQI